MVCSRSLLKQLYSREIGSNTRSEARWPCPDQVSILRSNTEWKALSRGTNGNRQCFALSTPSSEWSETSAPDTTNSGIPHPSATTFLRVRLYQRGKCCPHHLFTVLAEHRQALSNSTFVSIHHSCPVSRNHRLGEPSKYINIAPSSNLSSYTLRQSRDEPISRCRMPIRYSPLHTTFSCAIISFLPPKRPILCSAALASVERPRTYLSNFPISCVSFNHNDGEEELVWHVGFGIQIRVGWPKAQRGLLILIPRLAALYSVRS